MLAVVAIRTDGQKQLVSLERYRGESFDAWKGLVDDLGARGLAARAVCIIDGHPGCARRSASCGPTPASSGALCTNSTCFAFPRAQGKTLMTTNVIERLHEEFRCRPKTQGSLPTEEAALVMLFGLVVSGQIRPRRLDGWCQIPALLAGC